MKSEKKVSTDNVDIFMKSELGIYGCLSTKDQLNSIESIHSTEFIEDYF